MDGIHDMGGIQGYGPMPTERDSIPFHNDWEPLAYVFALLGRHLNLFTFDGGRHAIERIPARQYITMPYFERVLTGVASRYVEAGVVTKEELEERAGGAFPLSSAIGPPHRARRNHDEFAVGENVVVTTESPSGHMRAPGYTHGKKGIIVRKAPAAPFPGEAGHNVDAHVEPSYHVLFAAKDLWADASEHSSVVVDLFQSYLDFA